MASTSQYVGEMRSSTGTGTYSLEQLINMLGGTKNPTQSNYTPAEKIAVTDPRLRTIQEYLKELGATGYQYKYKDILNALNAATDAGYAVTQQELANAVREFYNSQATAQQSAADQIRADRMAAIEQGVASGIRGANMLSTILGTSQAYAQGAQALAEDRVTSAKEYAAQILGNTNDARNASNSAYETLMSNIRQLYNDEIQEKTADLEYNASLEETLANYLASQYNADTNYAMGVNSNASNVYASQVNALATMAAAAAQAAAQDNYSGALRAGSTNNGYNGNNGNNGNSGTGVTPNTGNTSNTKNSTKPSVGSLRIDPDLLPYVDPVNSPSTLSAWVYDNRWNDRQATAYYAGKLLEQAQPTPAQKKAAANAAAANAAAKGAATRGLAAGTGMYTGRTGKF